MSVRTSPWPPGIPNWVDLSTTDVAAAAALYGELFGWTLQDQGEQFGHYHLAFRDGHRCGGIGPVMGDRPPGWTVYVSSDDVTATAAAITAGGGAVLAGPFDVGDAGRQLVATDVGGALFSVWQHGTTIGSELVNEPGGLSWLDNWTADPQATAAFYTAVFGWQYEKVDAPGMDYWTFSRPGEQFPLGGAGRAQPGQAPHWNVYVGVESPDDGVAVVRRHGGSVQMEPSDSPYGRAASITDAQGASCVLFTPPPGDPQPDRSG